MAKPDPSVVGKFIKQLRIAKKLTQQQLADLIGKEAERSVSWSSVSAWERGNALPTDLLHPLSRVFSVSTDAILAGGYAPEGDDVNEQELRKLFSDDDLKHLDERQRYHLAALLLDSHTTPEKARVALELLLPKTRN